MSNFAYRNRNLHTSRPNALRSAPKSFRIMFGVVAAFIALTFVGIAIFMVTMLTNGGGYSYKVDYQFGNSSYSEEYSYNQ